MQSHNINKQNQEDHQANKQQYDEQEGNILNRDSHDQLIEFGIDHQIQDQKDCLINYNNFQQPIHASFKNYDKIQNHYEQKINYNIKGNNPLMNHNNNNNQISHSYHLNQYPQFILPNNSNNHSINPQNPSTTTHRCICKKTQCLKMYCQCFASNIPCNQQCSCFDCKNTTIHQKQIYQAKLMIRQKGIVGLHSCSLSQKRCNCKKSNCLKKYCQCYNSGVKCSEGCKCNQCKNCDNPYESDKDQEKKQKIKITNNKKKNKVKQVDNQIDLEQKNKIKNKSKRQSKKAGK